MTSMAVLSTGLRGRRRPTWALSTQVLLGLVVLLLLAVVFGTAIAPYSATDGDAANRLLGFGAPGHLLGTDGQGRDIVSRLILGTRLSLMTGVVPVLIAGTIGSAVGLCAGLASRLVNTLIMRTLDVFYSFPSILLAIGVAAALGPSIKNAIIALSIVLIPPVARIVEAEVVALRGAAFMKVAECSGASRFLIAVRHVVPNIKGPLVVYCTTLIGLSIVDAAGLSFLGLGASPPTAEWGLMLNDARNYFFRAPAVALAPALAILLVALLFNALGDRLRVELDVRERGATP
ncbi:MAG: ABC-type transporter, integral rane subunit [Frankiales bacterium]|jgi:peptide/nickel transport system permease protein|nr:ABC-type transporter, integral rane subunit [Frankiales bacterium]